MDHNYYVLLFLLLFPCFIVYQFLSGLYESSKEEKEEFNDYKIGDIVVPFCKIEEYSISRIVKKKIELINVKNIDDIIYTNYDSIKGYNHSYILRKRLLDAEKEKLEILKEKEKFDEEETNIKNKDLKKKLNKLIK